jgi:hypothetical protein
MITNYLSPASFLVVIDRLPNVEFFCQKVTIPDVSGSPQEMPTPLGNFYEGPSQLSYSDLDVSFIVDENMSNYLEIFRWMEGLGSPQTQEQFRNLQASPAGLKSDITVIINNNHKNPNIQFKFDNAFPISISSISLDITSNDITYVEATATFRYDKFKVAMHS